MVSKICVTSALEELTVILVNPQMMFNYKCQEVERDMRLCLGPFRDDFSGKGKFEPKAEG